jgi:S1-C subfamily serine protease
LRRRWAAAGLKQGDVITTVNGQPVVDATTVNYTIGTRRPGDSVNLAVRRDGRTQTLTVRAEPAPANPPRDTQTIGGRNPFTGATVENLSPAVADQLGIDTFGQGVIVARVAGGPAQAVGLQPGDIIRAVNGRRISSVRELVAAANAPAGAWQVTIERGGQQITATFQ